MAIVTDSAPVEAPKDPDANNVFALLRFFATPGETREWRERFEKGGVRYVDAKKRLIELLDEKFGAARDRRRELASRPEEVEAILQDGAAKTRRVASATLARARKACGID